MSVRSSGSCNPTFSSAASRHLGIPDIENDRRSSRQVAFGLKVEVLLYEPDPINQDLTPPTPPPFSLAECTCSRGTTGTPTAPADCDVCYFPQEPVADGDSVSLDETPRFLAENFRRQGSFDDHVDAHTYVRSPLCDVDLRDLKHLSRSYTYQYRYAKNLGELSIGDESDRDSSVTNRPGAITRRCPYVCMTFAFSVLIAMLGGVWCFSYSVWFTSLAAPLWPSSALGRLDEDSTLKVSRMNVIQELGDYALPAVTASMATASGLLLLALILFTARHVWSHRCRVMVFCCMVSMVILHLLPAFGVLELPAPHLIALFSMLTMSTALLGCISSVVCIEDITPIGFKASFMAVGMGIIVVMRDFGWFVARWVVCDGVKGATAPLTAEKSVYFAVFCFVAALFSVLWLQRQTLLAWSSQERTPYPSRSLASVKVQELTITRIILHTLKNHRFTLRLLSIQLGVSFAIRADNQFGDLAYASEPAISVVSKLLGLILVVVSAAVLGRSELRMSGRLYTCNMSLLAARRCRDASWLLSCGLILEILFRALALSFAADTEVSDSDLVGELGVSEAVCVFYMLGVAVSMIRQITLVILVVASTPIALRMAELVLVVGLRYCLWELFAALWLARPDWATAPLGGFQSGWAFAWEIGLSSALVAACLCSLSIYRSCCQWCSQEEGGVALRRFHAPAAGSRIDDVYGGEEEYRVGEQVCGEGRVGEQLCGEGRVGQQVCGGGRVGEQQCDEGERICGEIGQDCVEEGKIEQCRVGGQVCSGGVSTCGDSAMRQNSQTTAASL